MVERIRSKPHPTNPALEIVECGYGFRPIGWWDALFVFSPGIVILILRLFL